MLLAALRSTIRGGTLPLRDLDPQTTVPEFEEDSFSARVKYQSLGFHCFKVENVNRRTERGGKCQSEKTAMSLELPQEQPTPSGKGETSIWYAATECRAIKPARSR
eukprot:5737866-Amphidinium_carterae.1